MIVSALILGTLQGLTEFLPISSSGHLALLEHFLKLPLPAEQMAANDIFLHGGSLAAIVIYFWKDWAEVLKECGQMLKKLRLHTGSLAFRLAVGTVPAVLAGLFFGDALSTIWRDLPAIAVSFMLTGSLYLLVAKRGLHNKITAVSLDTSLCMGVAQVVAMIPAISRSGMTIVAGILLGLTQKSAARFSFLLGGIAILAANLYTLINLDPQTPLPGITFILMGTLASFIFSWLSIAFLLKFLQKYTLRAFGVYLILAGILILGLL